MAEADTNLAAYTAALASVETAIAQYATHSGRSVTIGQKAITYRSLDELLQLRNFYRSEIAKLNGTGGKARRILTRFA